LNERQILGRIDDDLSLVLLDEKGDVEHVFNRLAEAFWVDNKPKILIGKTISVIIDSTFKIGNFPAKILLLKMYLNIPFVHVCWK